MQRKEIDISEDFVNYLHTAENYIETGTIPTGMSRQSFLDKSKALNADERNTLRCMIRNFLPQCSSSTAEGTASLDSLSTACNWALLSGLASGMTQFQISKNLSSAAVTGFFIGSATFFARHKYKMSELVKINQARENRTMEFHLLLEDFPSMNLKQKFKI